MDYEVPMLRAFRYCILMGKTLHGINDVGKHKDGEEIMSDGRYRWKLLYQRLVLTVRQHYITVPWKVCINRRKLYPSRRFSSHLPTAKKAYYPRVLLYITAQV
jgi:hypothetical protein